MADEVELEETGHRYPHWIRAVFNEPWAVQESTLVMIAELTQLRAAGFRLTDDAISARLEAAAAANPRPPARRGGAVAVIPIQGVLMQRASMLEAMSGATSTTAIAAAFREAMNDDAVKAVMLEIDSPGGGVFGIEELAAEIFKARGTKPIVAMVNSLAASAAYWLATQADRIVVTPSGQVGSIGVVAVHMDMSGALAAEGVKPTVITTSQFKAEGNPYEPLPEDALAEIRGRMQAYHDMFVNAVARGRGVPAATVNSDFGQGRVVLAKDAVKRGMADRVGTFEQAIAELAGAGGVKPVPVGSATEDGPEMEATGDVSPDVLEARTARLIDIELRKRRDERAGYAGARAS